MNPVTALHQAQLYLVPEEVLRGEVSESLLKVQTSLEILQLFRSTYEDRRANLSQYQRNGRLVRSWDFSPLLVFSGFDHFIKRVKTIKVSIKTLNEKVPDVSILSVWIEILN